MRIMQPVMVYNVLLNCYNELHAYKCKRITLETLKIRVGYNYEI